MCFEGLEFKACKLTVEVSQVLFLFFFEVFTFFFSFFKKEEEKFKVNIACYVLEHWLETTGNTLGGKAIV